MEKRLRDRKDCAPARNLPGSRAKSPFVGRDAELRRLTAALDLAAEGEGSTIFLTGQPGIGKTRLAREALVLAKELGFTVLEGHASPLGAGLAYAPILNAFGPLLYSLDSVRLEFLVGDLPNLGRLFDGLRLPSPVLPLEGLGDPALEKTRLFEAVLRLLKRLIKEKPLVLFLDDVQWADPASLELLHFLAHGLADQPVLLLATYSDNALDTCRGLRALVVSLRRAGLAEEIDIPRLERDAVTALAQGILGGKAPGDLITLLDARACGTPLFVEAFIDALIDSRKLVRGP
ncbi:MAG: ATP-binding protein, partial [Dehalococcoidia bacterium]|nr:ATP-binding protein [Dehalococcoidia bacterium]